MLIESDVIMVFVVSICVAEAVVTVLLNAFSRSTLFTNTFPTSDMLSSLNAIALPSAFSCFFLVCSAVSCDDETNGNIDDAEGLNNVNCPFDCTTDTFI